MLTVQEVLGRILPRIQQLPEASLETREAVGCALAADVVAHYDVPRFDNSAMDGYALRSADVAQAAMSSPVRLSVIGHATAGSPASDPAGPGQAIAIATGAAMPAGVDAVVPLEQVTEVEGSIVVSAPLPPGRHVRRAGEDMSRGSALGTAGEVVTTTRAALAMAAGLATLPVIPGARVAVLSTGDELVASAGSAKAGQVVETNRLLLGALLEEDGAVPVDLGVCPDEVVTIARRIANASPVDAFLISGGLGKGQRDCVPEAIVELGQVERWDVALRPGKPCAFGTLAGRPVFCLPGNPVAAVVSYLAIARPGLARLMGRSERRPSERAWPAVEIANPAGRRQYVMVTLEGSDGRLVAVPCGAQRSASLSALAAADGFLVIPETETAAMPTAHYEVVRLPRQRRTRC